MKGSRAATGQVKDGERQCKEIRTDGERQRLACIGTSTGSGGRVSECWMSWYCSSSSRCPIGSYSCHVPLIPSHSQTPGVGDEPELSLSGQSWLSQPSSASTWPMASECGEQKRPTSSSSGSYTPHDTAPVSPIAGRCRCCSLSALVLIGESMLLVLPVLWLVRLVPLLPLLPRYQHRRWRTSRGDVPGRLVSPGHAELSNQLESCPPTPPLTQAAAAAAAAAVGSQVVTRQLCNI